MQKFSYFILQIHIYIHVHNKYLRIEVKENLHNNFGTEIESNLADKNSADAFKPENCDPVVE